MSKVKVSDSVSQWQGHLLSCCGQLKKTNFRGKYPSKTTSLYMYNFYSCLEGHLAKGPSAGVVGSADGAVATRSSFNIRYSNSLYSFVWWQKYIIYHAEFNSNSFGWHHYTYVWSDLRGPDLFQEKLALFSFVSQPGRQVSPFDLWKVPSLPSHW